MKTILIMLFAVISSSLFAQDTSIIQAEYFLDTDKGFGQNTVVNLAHLSEGIFPVNIALNATAPGNHKLYLRVRDSNGRWSFTSRRNIEVLRSDTNYITRAEYFFTTDSGFGKCTGVVFARPAADSSFAFNIPLSDVSNDTLFLRVFDNEGKWSGTIIKSLSTVLPVTLLSFNVAKQNNTAQLAWQIANESGTAYFNIQRSANGRSFATVGKTNALGNQTSYTFTDDISHLLQGRVYYRLQMVDRNGIISYSSIKSVDISSAFSIAILSNPVINRQANFSIYSPKSTRLQLAVYNQTGVVIYNREWTISAGNAIQPVNLSGFAAGSYWARVTNGISTQVLHFQKQ